MRHYSEIKPDFKTAPSIPNRKHPKRSYTGRGNDTIGPDHYEPKYTAICHRPKAVSFSRQSDYSTNKQKPEFANSTVRNLANLTTNNGFLMNNNKMVNKTLPGPGQYTTTLSTKQNFNSIFSYILSEQ